MGNSICLKRVNVHAPTNWLENTLNNFALGWPNKPFGATSFRQHDIETVIDMLMILTGTCGVVTIEQVRAKTNKMTCLFQVNSDLPGNTSKLIRIPLCAHWPPNKQNSHRSTEKSQVLYASLGIVVCGTDPHIERQFDPL